MNWRKVPEWIIEKLRTLDIFDCIFVFYRLIFPIGYIVLFWNLVSTDSLTWLSTSQLEKLGVSLIIISVMSFCLIPVEFRIKQNQNK